MQRSKPEFMARRVYERERTHQRGVLAAIILLLVFSVSPVFGHHVADPVTAMLAGRDHLLNLCLLAFHQLMAPVHDTFHVLVTAGFAYAIADRIRAVRRLRMALRALVHSTPHAGSIVERAARSVHVDARHLRVVRGGRAPAFTAGLWRPRIFVAQDLALALSTDELAAVIAHEDAHRRRRDPLRLSVWRFLACMLFFLPVLRRLEEDMADEAEVAADDDAVERARIQPLTLASALLAVARLFTLPATRSREVTAFHRDEMLGRRVRRLVGEDALVGTHLTRRSVSGAALALSAIWISGMTVTHPLPGAGGQVAAHAVAAHCAHEGEGPFSHLFCRGWRVSARDEPSSAGHCPHAVRLTPLGEGTP